MSLPRLRLVWSAHSWMLLVCLVFFLSYACSLTFEYVDGDDATSIAYHALGRDPAVLPHYAAYQVGLDLVLSLFPPEEQSLRQTAMTISAMSAIGFALLCLLLAWDLLPAIPLTQRPVLSAVVLLAIPELFYLGLLYTPALTGMCAMTGAHLLIRGAFSADGRRLPMQAGRFVFALVLLVSGILIRMDLAAYVVIILADLLFVRHVRPSSIFRRHGWLIVLAGGAALVGILGFLFSLSGLDLGTLGSSFVRIWELPRAVDGLPALAGAQQTLFTPATILLLVIAIASLIRLGDPRLLLAIAVIILLALWPLWMSPKALIIFIPPIMVFAVLGASKVIDWGRKHAWRAPTVYMVGALLIAPWFLGLEATRDDAAWGPGFELRAYDRPYSETSTVRLVLGAGAAVPTREGPRPLFGHLPVLIGGAWREMIASQARERLTALWYGIRHEMPILVIRGGPGLMLADLCRLNIRQVSPRHTVEGTEKIRSWDILTAEGRRTILVTVPLFATRDADQVLEELTPILGTPRVLVSGYPSAMRIMYLVSARSMHRLGRVFADVDLARLLSDLQSWKSKHNSRVHRSPP